MNLVKPDMFVLNKFHVCFVLDRFPPLDIDMLEEFAYLRTTEGGRVQLELLPNQGMLIK